MPNNIPVNQNLIDMEYAVRGPIPRRAMELQRAGRTIYACNIGNPQALKQKPISFYRQVLALLESSDNIPRERNLVKFAKKQTHLFEENKEVTSKYVHATSAGHEAIQLAVGMHLTENDWAAPYYRDDAMLLGIGITPYELMLQLLCKKDDPFSGGRTYYSHPSLKREGFPKIPSKYPQQPLKSFPCRFSLYAFQGSL